MKREDWQAIGIGTVFALALVWFIQSETLQIAIDEELAEMRAATHATMELQAGLFDLPLGRAR